MTASSVRVKSSGPTHLPAASGDGTSGSPLNIKYVPCDENGVPYSSDNPLPISGVGGGGAGYVGVEQIDATGSSYDFTQDVSATTYANVFIECPAATPGDTITITLPDTSDRDRFTVTVKHNTDPPTVAFSAGAYLFNPFDLAESPVQVFLCIPRDSPNTWDVIRQPVIDGEGVSGGGGLADQAESTLFGRAAGAGTGAPGVLTATQARTALGLGTAATVDTGTGSGNVILGNDARLTDTRTPTDASVSVAKLDATQTTRLTAHDALLWRPVDVDPLFPYTGSSGTWAVAQNSAGLYGGWKANSAGTANGDYMQWANVAIPAGTYTVVLAAQKTTGSGIVDVLIDGSSIGTVDLYNGSTTNDYWTVTTSYAPSSTALVTVKLLLNGKNASSSGYLARLSRLIFRRTA